MNTQYIEKEIRPHVVGNQLTYDAFDQIFGFLPRKEQYQICDAIQDELKIELVDEITSSPVEEEVPAEVAPLVVKKPHEIKVPNKFLVRLIQEGDEQARQDLCVKNVGLVGKFAVKYLKQYPSELELEDLMQEGFAGMLKAAERFDFSQGTEFSTYATWWIRQSISRAIADTGLTIRLPVHMIEKINKATRLDQKLQLEGVTVRKRIELIAAELNTTAEDVRNCFKWRELYMHMKSLDVPVMEDNDTPLVDFIVDEAPETFDTIAFMLLKEELEDVLGTLTPRERDVLRLRYGLKDGRERTLEEVGKSFNVTRERIRQIEAKALRKLRHPARMKKLKDFLD